jgi:hypothetical protein
MAQEVKIKEKKQRINNCSIAPGELNAFLFANQEKELPEKVMLKIRDQSIDILCKCVKPTYKEIGKISETGLVIGYVQSGKTLSFKYQASAEGFVPSTNQVGNVGATLPPYKNSANTILPRSTVSGHEP